MIRKLGMQLKRSPMKSLTHKILHLLEIGKIFNEYFVKWVKKVLKGLTIKVTATSLIKTIT